MVPLTELLELALNKMNCVVYPPSSAKCGKNNSAGDDTLSETGGVVVIRKSPRSFVRLRKPTAVIGVVLVIRSNP